MDSFSMQDNVSGSSSSGEPEFLAVGMLRRPHGVSGEIVLSVWTDFPERLTPGLKVYLGENHLETQIRSTRKHQEGMLVALEGFADREAVGLLRNQVLMVRADAIPPLEEGEYYFHELIGLSVVDNKRGETLGVITEILETGANDVFIVRSDEGKEILIPDIDEVISAIDLEKQEVRVDILPGLL